MQNSFIGCNMAAYTKPCFNPQEITINMKKYATLLAFSCLISGCQVVPNKDKIKAPETSEIKPVTESPEVAKLRQCQQEMEALKTVNAKKYSDVKNQFDALMSGAAQYSGLRSKVNNDMQTTVDALYRYRVSMVCSKVNQTLLLSLAEKGEAVK